MAKPTVQIYKFSNQINDEVPISGLFIVQFDTLVELNSGNITFEVIDGSSNSNIVYNVSTSGTIVDYRLNPSDPTNNASYLSIAYNGLVDKCQYAINIDGGIVLSKDDSTPNDQYYQTVDVNGLTKYQIQIKANSTISSKVPPSIAFDVSTSPLVSANGNVITLDLSTTQLSPYTKYRIKFDDGAIMSTTGEVLLFDNFPEYYFITGS